MKRLDQIHAFTLLSISLLVSACGPAVNEDGIARSTVQEIDRTFQDTARAELALSPETATRLGLEERTLRQTFNDLLDDRSQARFERTRLLRLELSDRLNRLPDIPDDSRLARHLDIIRNQYKVLTRLEAYGFGRYEPGLARPYAVDQLSGAWINVPDLLIASQPLSSHADAEDYLKRLAALPGAIADERRRLMSDAANGIVPPRFVLDLLEQRLRAFVAEPIGTHPMIQTFGTVVGGLDPEQGRPANEYRGAATRLMLEEVLPAYRDFADAVAELKADAPEMPGLQIGAETEVYYRDSLSFYTQPGADPDFLHQQGLQAVSDILAELDVQFASLGLEAGTVQQRLALLVPTSQQPAETTQAARDAVLRQLEDLVVDAEAALPEMIDNPPGDPLIVTRMPAYKERAFSGAVYVPARANGTSPGLFEINLGHLEDWPDFALPTLVYHEGIPGHHTEAGVAARVRLPLLRQMMWDTAYGEGWAVYAEDLADGAGLYSNDPLGRIGYLQSVLFRAARLVVDTGIHAKGWSYQEAVDYLVETTGLPRASMEEEVARYAVWPGQAAAYFNGRYRIIDMRVRAEAVLGGRFDEAAFNAVLLEGGPRPLSMVEQDVEAWYGELLQN